MCLSIGLPELATAKQMANMTTLDTTGHSHCSANVLVHGCTQAFTGMGCMEQVRGGLSFQPPFHKPQLLLHMHPLQAAVTDALTQRARKHLAWSTISQNPWYKEKESICCKCTHGVIKLLA